MESVNRAVIELAEMTEREIVIAVLDTAMFA